MTASAQSINEAGKSFGFTKGIISVEGNLGFNSSNDKNNDSNVNSLSFTPQIGFFVSDDLDVGVQVDV